MRKSKFPTHYPKIIVDTRYDETEEAKKLLRLAGNESMDFYMMLCKKFCNMDGCLAYSETIDGKTSLVPYKLYIQKDTVVAETGFYKLFSYRDYSAERISTFLFFMLMEDIHLIYQRADGMFAITGLTSDKSGPPLHLYTEDAKFHTGDGKYFPITTGISGTRYIGMENTRNNYTKSGLLGKSITEISYMSGIKRNTLQQFVKRNGLDIFFEKSGKSKILPEDKVDDLITCYKGNITAQELTKKWYEEKIGLPFNENSIEISNQNITNDDENLMIDKSSKTYDWEKKTYDKHMIGQNFGINKPFETYDWAEKTYDKHMIDQNDKKNGEKNEEHMTRTYDKHMTDILTTYDKHMIGQNFGINKPKKLGTQNPINIKDKILNTKNYVVVTHARACEENPWLEFSMRLKIQQERSLQSGSLVASETVEQEKELINFISKTRGLSKTDKEAIVKLPDIDCWEIFKNWMIVNDKYYDDFIRKPVIETNTKAWIIGVIKNVIATPSKKDSKMFEQFKAIDFDFDTMQFTKLLDSGYNFEYFKILYSTEKENSNEN